MKPAKAKKVAAKKDNPEKRLRIEHLYRAAKMMQEAGLEVAPRLTSISKISTSGK